MKLYDKLMYLHLHHAPRYTNYLLTIEVIDKNNICNETIEYVFDEGMDEFRRLGDKLQWEVVDALTFGNQIIIRIREKEEMKEYTIEEALGLLIRGYSASKRGFLTVKDQKMIAKIKSDIADLKGDTVDWSKVKVDTKILVRGNEQADWGKRYFAKYENELVYVWGCGRTSWSAFDKEVFGWKYAKLAEEEEND